MRKEIDKKQKELIRFIQIFKVKREKQGGGMREQEAIRLREQRRDLEKDTALSRAEIYSNKAPPPPAPKAKAPPTNLLAQPPKSQAKSAQLSHEDESRCISGEEEHGDIDAAPIDLTKPEQVAGPRNLMKLGIAERKDEIERNGYVEKQRSSHPFKIIRDPG